MTQDIEKRTCDRCGKTHEHVKNECRAGGIKWAGWYRLTEHPNPSKGGITIPGGHIREHDFCSFDCLARSIEEGKTN